MELRFSRCSVALLLLFVATNALRGPLIPGDEQKLPAPRSRGSSRFNTQSPKVVETTPETISNSKFSSRRGLQNRKTSGSQIPLPEEGTTLKPLKTQLNSRSNKFEPRKIDKSRSTASSIEDIKTPTRKPDFNKKGTDRRYLPENEGTRGKSVERPEPTKFQKPLFQPRQLSRSGSSDPLERSSFLDKNGPSVFSASGSPEVSRSRTGRKIQTTFTQKELRTDIPTSRRFASRTSDAESRSLETGKGNGSKRSSDTSRKADVISRRMDDFSPRADDSSKNDDSPRKDDPSMKLDDSFKRTENNSRKSESTFIKSKTIDFSKRDSLAAGSENVRVNVPTVVQITRRSAPSTVPTITEESSRQETDLRRSADRSRTRGRTFSENLRSEAESENPSGRTNLRRGPSRPESKISEAPEINRRHGNRFSKDEVDTIKLRSSEIKSRMGDPDSRSRGRRPDQSSTQSPSTTFERRSGVEKGSRARIPETRTPETDSRKRSRTRARVETSTAKILEPITSIPEQVTAFPEIPASTGRAEFDLGTTTVASLQTGTSPTIVTSRLATTGAPGDRVVSTTTSRASRRESEGTTRARERSSTLRRKAANEDFYNDGLGFRGRRPDSTPIPATTTTTTAPQRATTVSQESQGRTNPGWTLHRRPYFYSGAESKQVTTEEEITTASASTSKSPGRRGNKTFSKTSGESGSISKQENIEGENYPPDFKAKLAQLKNLDLSSAAKSTPRTPLQVHKKTSSSLFSARSRMKLENARKLVKPELLDEENDSKITLDSINERKNLDIDEEKKLENKLSEIHPENSIGEESVVKPKLAKPKNDEERAIKNRNTQGRNFTPKLRKSAAVEDRNSTSENSTEKVKNEKSKSSFSIRSKPKVENRIESNNSLGKGKSYTRRNKTSDFSTTNRTKSTTLRRSLKDTEEDKSKPPSRKSLVPRYRNAVKSSKTSEKSESVNSEKTEKTGRDSERARPKFSEKSRSKTESKVSEKNESKVSERAGPKFSAGSKGSERNGSKGSERNGSKSSERNGSKGTERTGSKGTERTGSKSSERTGSKSSERTGSKGSERTGSKFSERAGPKSSERTGPKFSERAESKVSERTGSKISERTETKVPERTRPKFSARAGSKNSGKVSEKPGPKISEKFESKIPISKESTFLDPISGTPAPTTTTSETNFIGETTVTPVTMQNYISVTRTVTSTISEEISSKKLKINDLAKSNADESKDLKTTSEKSQILNEVSKEDKSTTRKVIKPTSRYSRTKAFRSNSKSSVSTTKASFKEGVNNTLRKDSRARTATYRRHSEVPIGSVRSSTAQPNSIEITPKATRFQVSSSSSPPLVTQEPTLNVKVSNDSNSAQQQSIEILNGNNPSDGSTNIFSPTKNVLITAGNSTLLEQIRSTVAPLLGSLAVRSPIFAGVINNSTNINTAVRITPNGSPPRFSARYKGAELFVRNPSISQSPIPSITSSTTPYTPIEDSGLPPPIEVSNNGQPKVLTFYQALESASITDQQLKTNLQQQLGGVAQVDRLTDNDLNGTNSSNNDIETITVAVTTASSSTDTSTILSEITPSEATPVESEASPENSPSTPEAPSEKTSTSESNPPLSDENTFLDINNRIQAATTIISTTSPEAEQATNFYSIPDFLNNDIGELGSNAVVTSSENRSLGPETTTLSQEDANTTSSTTEVNVFIVTPSKYESTPESATETTDESVVNSTTADDSFGKSTTVTIDESFAKSIIESVDKSVPESSTEYSSLFDVRTFNNEPISVKTFPQATSGEEAFQKLTNIEREKEYFGSASTSHPIRNFGQQTEFTTQIPAFTDNFASTTNRIENININGRFLNDWVEASTILSPTATPAATVPSVSALEISSTTEIPSETSSSETTISDSVVMSLTTRVVSTTEGQSTTEMPLVTEVSSEMPLVMEVSSTEIPLVAGTSTEVPLVTGASSTELPLSEVSSTEMPLSGLSSTDTPSVTEVSSTTQVPPAAGVPFADISSSTTDQSAPSTSEFPTVPVTSTTELPFANSPTTTILPLPSTTKKRFSTTSPSTFMPIGISRFPKLQSFLESLAQLGNPTTKSQVMQNSETTTMNDANFVDESTTPHGLLYTNSDIFPRIKKIDHDQYSSDIISAHSTVSPVIISTTFTSPEIRSKSSLNVEVSENFKSTTDPVDQTSVNFSAPLSNQNNLNIAKDEFMNMTQSWINDGDSALPMDNELLSRLMNVATKLTSKPSNDTELLQKTPQIRNRSSVDKMPSLLGGFLDHTDRNHTTEFTTAVDFDTTLTPVLDTLSRIIEQTDNSKFPEATSISNPSLLISNSLTNDAPQTTFAPVLTTEPNIATFSTKSPQTQTASILDLYAMLSDLVTKAPTTPLAQEFGTQETTLTPSSIEQTVEETTLNTPLATTMGSLITTPDSLSNPETVTPIVLTRFQDSSPATAQGTAGANLITSNLVDSPSTPSSLPSTSSPSSNFSPGSFPNFPPGSLPTAPPGSFPTFSPGSFSTFPPRPYPTFSPGYLPSSPPRSFSPGYLPTSSPGSFPTFSPGSFTTTPSTRLQPTGFNPNVPTTTPSTKLLPTSFGTTLPTTTSFTRLVPVSTDSALPTSTLPSSVDTTLPTTSSTSTTAASSSRLLNNDATSSMNDSGAGSSTQAPSQQSTTPYLGRFGGSRITPAPRFSSSSSTTAPLRDYLIYGIYPNKTIVRKRPEDNLIDARNIDSPYVIFGIYPDGRLVRKFPNGTVIPDPPSNPVEVVFSLSTTTTTTTTNRPSLPVFTDNQANQGSRNQNAALSNNRSPAATLEKQIGLLGPNEVDNGLSGNAIGPIGTTSPVPPSVDSGASTTQQMVINAPNATSSVPSATSSSSSNSNVVAGSNGSQQGGRIIQDRERDEATRTKEVEGQRSAVYIGQDKYINYWTNDQPNSNPQLLNIKINSVSTAASEANPNSPSKVPSFNLLPSSGSGRPDFPWKDPLDQIFGIPTNSPPVSASVASNILDDVNAQIAARAKPVNSFAEVFTPPSSGISSTSSTTPAVSVTVTTTAATPTTTFATAPLTTSSAAPESTNVQNGLFNTNGQKESTFGTTYDDLAFLNTLLNTQRFGRTTPKTLTEVEKLLADKILSLALGKAGPTRSPKAIQPSNASPNLLIETDPNSESGPVVIDLYPSLTTEKSSSSTWKPVTSTSPVIVNPWKTILNSIAANQIHISTPNSIENVSSSLRSLFDQQTTTESVPRIIPKTTTTTTTTTTPRTTTTLRTTTTPQTTTTTTTTTTTPRTTTTTTTPRTTTTTTTTPRTTTTTQRTTMTSTYRIPISAIPVEVTTRPPRPRTTTTEAPRLGFGANLLRALFRGNFFGSPTTAAPVRYRIPVTTPKPVTTTQRIEQTSKRVVSNIQVPFPTQSAIQVTSEGQSTKEKVRANLETASSSAVGVNDQNSKLSSTFSPEEDAKFLTALLNAAQVKGSSTLAPVGSISNDDEAFLKSILNGQASIQPTPYKGEHVQNDAALLAALLKAQGIEPSTPANQLREQLFLAGLEQNRDVRSSSTTTTTTRRTTTRPRPATPTWKPSSTYPPPLFGGFNFAGSSDSFKDESSSNDVRSQVVNAAIGMTRVFSQFLGGAIRGAAKQLQSFVGNGTRPFFSS